MQGQDKWILGSNPARHCLAEPGLHGIKVHNPRVIRAACLILSEIGYSPSRFLSRHSQFSMGCGEAWTEMRAIDGDAIASAWHRAALNAIWEWYQRGRGSPGFRLDELNANTEAVGEVDLEASAGGAFAAPQVTALARRFELLRLFDRHAQAIGLEFSHVQGGHVRDPVAMDGTFHLGDLRAAFLGH